MSVPFGTDLVAQFLRYGYEALAQGEYFDPISRQIIALTDEQKARIEKTLDGLAAEEGTP